MSSEAETGCQSQDVTRKRAAKKATTNSASVSPLGAMAAAIPVDISEPPITAMTMSSPVHPCGGPEPRRSPPLWRDRA